VLNAGRLSKPHSSQTVVSLLSPHQVHIDSAARADKCEERERPRTGKPLPSTCVRDRGLFQQIVQELGVLLENPDDLERTQHVAVV
jgi:hypothetical protein